MPYHPGFGESAADPDVTEIHDYVLHYLELFETLGLKKVRIVGQSTGGFIAAKLGIEHASLIERLALVCPIGIPTPGHPTADFMKVPPQDLPALLAYDPQTVIKRLPTGVPDAAFIAEREKEAVTAARARRAVRRQAAALPAPPHDADLCSSGEGGPAHAGGAATRVVATPAVRRGAATPTPGTSCSTRRRRRSRISPSSSAHAERGAAAHSAGHGSANTTSA